MNTRRSEGVRTATQLSWNLILDLIRLHTHTHKQITRFKKNFRSPRARSKNTEAILFALYINDIILLLFCFERQVCVCLFVFCCCFWFGLFFLKRKRYFGCFKREKDKQTNLFTFSDSQYLTLFNQQLSGKSTRLSTICNGFIYLSILFESNGSKVWSINDQIIRIVGHSYEKVVLKAFRTGINCLQQIPDILILNCSQTIKSRRTRQAVVSSMPATLQISAGNASHFTNLKATMDYTNERCPDLHLPFASINCLPSGTLITEPTTTFFFPS